MPKAISTFGFASNALVSGCLAIYWVSDLWSSTRTETWEVQVPRFGRPKKFVELSIPPADVRSMGSPSLLLCN